MDDLGEPNDPLLREFVDFLMPLLKPYEASVYLYLLRKTHLEGSSTVRIGGKTISKEIGIGARSPSGGNLTHIREVLRALETKGCIEIGDRARNGTLYTVRLPREVEGAQERIAAMIQPPKAEDYFRDPVLRNSLFVRDRYTCKYCGETVTGDNATLDHVVPVSRGGADTEVNLVTACLICNSLKSGKTYEEAAPLILASVRDRRLRAP